MKQTSWSLVLALISSRNKASIPAPPATGLSATTPLTVCNASYGFTLGDWLPIQTAPVDRREKGGKIVIVR